MWLHVRAAAAGSDYDDDADDDAYLGVADSR